MDEEHTERTLTVLRECHVYTLPPRPAASGWKCQDWPKTSHVFTGRVRVVAKGDQCTVKLEDSESGSLFAQCPLDNDKPEVSVEPVSDSSRYFVIRVVDNSGRHAFLGMGFKERNDAFDFNVNLQDHVKHIKNEKESAAIAAAPPPPSQDFSLTGSISINIGQKERAAPRAPAPAAPGGATGFLAPPPPGGGGGKRPTGRPTQAAAPAPASGFGDDWAAFGAPAPAPAPATAPAPAPASGFGDDWVAFG